MRYCTLKFLVLTTLLIAACEDYDDFEVPDNLRVHDFIWKGLNLYYLWQPTVDDLRDDRFANQHQLNEWLYSRPAPTQFFGSLLAPGQIDRFSRIFSDYTVLENALNGITKNNGVDYALHLKPGSSTEVFGWVRYILPGSDAAQKNIHRGDIFYAVNGTALTIQNYAALLSAETYTLNLANFDGGNITPNGEQVTVTKTVISENPIYKKSVIEMDGQKIGYLMYNGFYPGYEAQLNHAFGELKSAGVNHLVLDLRYNSGGSIATASRLASMVTGQFFGQIFAREQWNEKAQQHLNSQNAESLINRFVGTIGSGAAINSLNLHQVHILTSPSTASASELVINGLRPYINVIQIGETTTGKNVGSITLYDSANFRKEGASPAHKYAMQPIVLKIVNRDGFGDYQTGLAPDHHLPEDITNLGQIGEITEPLLSTAIGHIVANGRMMIPASDQKINQVIDSKSIEALRSEMYRDLR